MELYQSLTNTRRLFILLAPSIDFTDQKFEILSSCFHDRMSDRDQKSQRRKDPGVSHQEAGE